MIFDIKRDTEIMKTLKVSEISHRVAHTNLGEITFKLRFGESEYQPCLDSVPLDEEKSKLITKLWQGDQQN